MGAPALTREFIAGQMPPPEPPKYSPRTRVLVLLALIIITWSPIIAAVYFKTKGN